MDDLSWIGLSPWELQLIQNVQLYLWVSMLLEICNQTGTHILLQYLQMPEFSQLIHHIYPHTGSTLKWPIQMLLTKGMEAVAQTHKSAVLPDRNDQIIATPQSMDIRQILTQLEMGLVHQYPHKTSCTNKIKLNGTNIHLSWCKGPMHSTPWHQTKLTSTYLTCNPSYTHQHSNGHPDWPTGCTNPLPNQQSDAITSTPNTPMTSYPIISMGFQIMGPHPSPNLDPWPLPTPQHWQTDHKIQQHHNEP